MNLAPRPSSFPPPPPSRGSRTVSKLRRHEGLVSLGRDGQVARAYPDLIELGSLGGILTLPPPTPNEAERAQVAVRLRAGHDDRFRGRTEGLHPLREFPPGDLGPVEIGDE